MTRIAFAAVLMLAAGLAWGAEPPTRAKRLETLRAEFEQAGVDFRREVRSGKLKPDADGEYAEWVAVPKRFEKPARDLIGENPADAAALDTLVFCIEELGVEDVELYRLVLKHHLASKAVESLVRRSDAPAEFQRAVAATSPDSVLRLWAKYHLAENLADAGKPGEAETLLGEVELDEKSETARGYNVPTLADQAAKLLFAIRKLSVGKVAPDLTGIDLDGKPLKLSDRRGKVTLIVFWATWCGPCMAMVPHERKLAEAYAARPFAIVGVNGELPPKGLHIDGPDGKPIDSLGLVRAAAAKAKMTWPSFQSGREGIPAEWSVRTWPTIYLLDHDGVIRHKWKGDPGTAVLDAAVEKLVSAAEGKAK